MSFKILKVIILLAVYIFRIPVKCTLDVSSIDVQESQEIQPHKVLHEPNVDIEKQVISVINNTTISTTQTTFHESSGKFFKKYKSYQKETISDHKNQLGESSLRASNPNPTLGQNSLMNARLENYPLGQKSNKRTRRSDAVNKTKPEDHPYAVILFVFDQSQYVGCCSGSLVTLEWVLTAASHCFSLDSVTVSHVQVYAGGSSEQEWMKKTFPAGHQLRNSSEYYVHPEYSREPFYVSYFDVALVKVEPFVKSSSVSEVEIHGRPWQFQGFANCTLTGFGRHQFYEDRDDDFVRKTYHLKAKSPCPCLNTQKTKYHNWICSKPMKEFGICGSDWGAALVCGNQIRALASVVISYKDLNTCKKDDYQEYTCSQENSLSIFQNTFPCMKWINSHIDKYIVKPMNAPNLATKLLSRICLFFIFTIAFENQLYHTY